MSNTAIHQASLFFKEGGSDKVYFAQVSPEGSGFVVTFSYGRREAALQHGSKTAGGPVPEAEAVKIFDKLIKEKTSKGYKPMAGEASSPKVEALVADKVDSGLRSQLPSPAEEEAAKAMLYDDRYLMQEKVDGHHKLASSEGGKITTANKKGQEVPTPSELAAAIRQIGKDVTLDFEHVGDSFLVFDLLSLGGVNLRPKSYEQRYREMETLLSKLPTSSPIKLVRAAMSSAEKLTLWNEIEKRDGEGVVFKLKSSTFSPGKSADGASLKFKFYATLSAVVSGVTAGRRSIALSLLNSGEEVAVGKCTVPANHEIPKIGSVVEVRYLYAHRGGSLFQPTYLGPRDDVDKAECVTDQLKYKPEDTGESEE